MSLPVSILWARGLNFCMITIVTGRIDRYLMVTEIKKNMPEFISICTLFRAEMALVSLPIIPCWARCLNSLSRIINGSPDVN